MKPLTEAMKAASLLGPTVDHTNDNIYTALKQLKKWPKIATLKVDGIRGLRTTDLVSCRNIMIPNVSIRRRSMVLPYGFDCELYAPHLQYDEIESIVMSEEHEKSDEIQFYAIDHYSGELYSMRLNELRVFIQGWQQDHDNAEDWYFKMPFTLAVNTPQDLMDFFLQTEQQEGEGICFRTPDSPYKQGRSTLAEEYLIKLCRYVREEVTIIGTYEQMLNKNVSRLSEIGKSKRSRAQGAMVGKDTLGGFYVRDGEGQEFKVGTGVGLTELRRQQLWEVRESLVGKQITIKSKSHGKKIKPRSPIYIGMREEGF